MLICKLQRVPTGNLQIKSQKKYANILFKKPLHWPFVSRFSPSPCVPDNSHYLALQVSLHMLVCCNCNYAKRFKQSSKRAQFFYLPRVSPLHPFLWAQLHVQLLSACKIYCMGSLSHINNTLHMCIIL